MCDVFMEKAKKTGDRRIVTGIWVVLFYFIATYFAAVPLLLLQPFGIDYTKMPEMLQNIYLFFYQVIMILIISKPFTDKLINDFDDLKKNHKEYFKKYFKLWFLLIGSVAISNMLINIVHPGIAGNQESINETLKVAPIYMYLSAVLIAPILEELVFRQAIRYIFPNNVVFIIMSGLIFGALHVIGSYESYLDLLYIIPYGIPGSIFAYILSKTNNIYTTMFMHFIHNSVSMSIIIFGMLFL